MYSGSFAIYRQSLEECVCDYTVYFKQEILQIPLTILSNFDASGKSEEGNSRNFATVRHG